MNKKISLGAAIAMAAIIAAATFSITMVYSRQTFNNTILNIKERETTYSKLSEIDKWVRQNYYGAIDNDRLMDSIAQGYVLGTGDPYAKYYTVEEYARLSQSGASKSVGVGFVTQVDDSGYILITEVYPDSPALAAGIEAGDLIVRVDDTDVSKDNAQEMLDAIMGEAGTKLDIVIRRDNTDTPRSLTRRDVEKPSVYGSMTQDKIGYVQILEFNSNTSDQFNRAVDKLVSDGAVTLVFDVRNNTGSMYEPVTRILDKLLPKGDIVSATYKDGTTRVLATSDAAFINLPMVVLVNEKTASSAELFAQALKDYKLAQTVGVTTTGKGTMQTVQQLNDGSAISITVAKYNPPSSQNFDGIGVKPDFEVKVTKDQADAIAAFDKTSAENLQMALEFDSQLKKAMELAATASNTVSSSSDPEISSDAPSVSDDSSEDNGFEIEDGSEDESNTDSSQEDGSSSEDESGSSGEPTDETDESEPAGDSSDDGNE